MVLTTVVAVVLAVLPGGLLGFAVPAGRDRWAIWATAPVLTLGLTSAGMAWLPKVGLPDSVHWVLGAELTLAAVIVAGCRVVEQSRAGTRRVGRRRAEPGNAEPVTGPLVPARVAVAVGAHPASSQRPVDRTVDGAGSAVGSGPAELPAGSRFVAPSGRASLDRRSWAVEVISVTVPAAVTVILGYLVAGGLPQPPGWDGMNHALLTRNILATGSTAFSSVCTTGSTHPVVACTFYPLAEDVAWAQAAAISGGRISAAMTAWSILVGPLLLVASVYAAVRILAGRPVVAGCAAAACGLLGPFWGALFTGRITEQTGPALSVAVAVLVAVAVRGAHPVRLGLVAGLASAGLLMTHTYDALFAATLAIALAVGISGRLHAQGAAKGIGVAALSAGLVLLPISGALLGSKAERSAANPRLLGQVGDAFYFWIFDLQRYVVLAYPFPTGTDSQPRVTTVTVALWITVVCLLVSPLCLVLRDLRWARPWLAVWALWTAIGIWTSSSNSGPALALAGLWYGRPERLWTMFLPVYGVLAVAGAGAVGLIIQRVVTRARARSARSEASWLPAAVAAAVVTALVGLAAAPDTRLPVHADMARRAPAGSAYPAMFTWLARHTPPGDVVAYDRHLEFMTWSYADYGVPLLFGIPPLMPQNVEDYFKGRYGAWYWLVNEPGAKPGGCFVQKYRIAYVVTGKARMPGWPAHYSRKRLAASPRVRLVYRTGDLNAYAVLPSGRACATRP